MNRASLTARPRLPGPRRGVAVLTSALGVVAVGLGCCTVASASAAGARASASVTRPLVVLLRDHVVQAKPRDRAPHVESVSALRPLTGVRTVLPVLGRASSPGGKRWVRVRLPGRPNGHAGWIAARQTRRATTGWQLVLDLSARLVTVHRDGRAARRFRAVVGAPSTPTPRGRFFVEEALALSGQVG
ncbi:MAG TPA: L,D-transpeptidase, partial [Conexibacter sp.]|nr:L,D-transpeptidase [Conexibacter sp.]